MNSDQKRAFLAITLSGAILFGWQYFFAPKQTAQTVNNQAPQTSAAPVVANNANIQQASATNNVSNQNIVNANPAAATLAKKFTLSDGKISMVIDSRLSIYEMSNKQAERNFNETIGPLQYQLLFSSMSGFKAVDFNVTEKPASLVFTNDAEGLEVTAVLVENKVHFRVISKNQRKASFNLVTTEKEKHSGHVRNYAVLGKSLETTAVGSDDQADGSFQWFGVDYDYHLFAIAFSNKIPGAYRIGEDKKFSFIANKDANGLEFDVFYVKKEYDYLHGLGSNLHLAVDFGVFSILAVPILRGLQWIYDFIPNYGVAIIFLTLLLRLVTFPLQWKSYKSMKKMQDIQPELTKLKEKYKDDPQRMQRESMELFKRAGANPLGGCLPLLLQMPFFFAFYKVLYGAVELVDAPFLLWIQDLSAKDPFYVLPVLMAGAMFLQQKLSPTTVTDPAQKKVMLFMPLIFALIMKDLPSGLCLYIFISTIFGVLQQMFVYKRTA
jgi:YidC/Oxa1 family membrane protein insertase